MAPLDRSRQRARLAARHSPIRGHSPLKESGQPLVMEPLTLTLIKRNQLTPLFDIDLTIRAGRHYSSPGGTAPPGLLIRGLWIRVPRGPPMFVYYAG